MTAVSSKAGSEPEKNNSKKEKFSPPTKIVIRRLPPSMTKDEFEEQVSPIPDHDYLRCFVKMINVSIVLTPHFASDFHTGSAQGGAIETMCLAQVCHVPHLQPGAPSAFLCFHKN